MKPHSSAPSCIVLVFSAGPLLQRGWTLGNPRPNNGEDQPLQSKPAFADPTSAACTLWDSPPVTTTHPTFGRAMGARAPSARFDDEARWPHWLVHPNTTPCWDSSVHPCRTANHVARLLFHCMATMQLIVAPSTAPPWSSLNVTTPLPRPLGQNGADGEEGQIFDRIHCMPYLCSTLPQLLSPLSLPFPLEFPFLNFPRQRRPSRIRSFPRDAACLF